ncbi:MAG: hypothetical protein J0I50_10600 [Microbacterium sp.]|nr:hypothetical protein [Microbacterium sp.]
MTAVDRPALERRETSAFDQLLWTAISATLTVSSCQSFTSSAVRPGRLPVVSGRLIGSAHVAAIVFVCSFMYVFLVA